MSDQQLPAPPKSEQPATTPPEREPWATPTLESLDVSETMARRGSGTDGGPMFSTLS
jgi:hypothetical protein